MRKACLILILFCSIFTSIFSSNMKGSIEVKDYSYPYKNPNLATIVGSSTLMIDNVTPLKEINIKEYTTEINKSSEIPELFWYQEGYKFSLIKQKSKAPLIFILAGTGATHNSKRMQYFQRIFYDAGYSVISISSSVSSNSIINASSFGMPGPLKEDSQDIYNVMEKIYSEVGKKVEVSDFYLMGYSLGATQAAFISYLDDQQKKFNFKRVLMLNPVVDLKKSATKLDKLLDENIDGDKKNIGKIVDDVLDKLSKHAEANNEELNEETIFSLFKNEKLSDKDKEAIIGFAFRIISIDTNFVTDYLNKRNVYTDKEIGKFDSIFRYFEKVDFANFNEYLSRLLIPYSSEKGVSEEELLEKLKINQIEEYLKNSKKIAVVTNKDELILDKGEIAYLENVFGNRMILFPHGGHCGNMYYAPNVKMMLNYLNKGVISYVE